MKEDFSQYKIRLLAKEKNRDTFGVTIPSKFEHWFGIMVTIRESGNVLILESGTKPEPLHIKDIKAKTIEVIHFDR